MTHPSISRPDLVASDLDGTLLAPDLTFSPDLPGSVAALRAADVPFVICTGRMYGSARRVAARLGIYDGLIACYHGALVADLATGERLLHRPIPAEVAAEVVRDVRNLGRHLNAFIDDRVYVEQMDEWARRYAAYAEVESEQVDDLAAAVAERSPTKFVVLSEARDVEQLVPRLRALWDGRVAVTRSQSEYLEIVNPGVSKSGSLQWLCERLGLRRERTVACGDGPNDIDMLEWAAVGVAVAEAAPEVRGAADLVLPRQELGALFRQLALS